MLRTIVPKALSNLGKKVGSQLSKEIGAVVEQGKGQTPGAPKPQDEGAGAAPELPNVPPAIPIIIDRLAK